MGLDLFKLVMPYLNVLPVEKSLLEDAKTAESTLQNIHARSANLRGLKAILWETWQ